MYPSNVLKDLREGRGRPPILPGAGLSGLGHPLKGRLALGRPDPSLHIVPGGRDEVHAAGAAASIGDSEMISSLLARVKKLEQDSAAMRQYMSDNGLTWPPPAVPPAVPAPSSSSSSSSSSSGPALPSASVAPAAANTSSRSPSSSADSAVLSSGSTVPPGVRIGTEHLPIMIEKIEELNQLAPARQHRVDPQRGHGRFSDNDEILIVFYMNGISVNRGPLRPYDWPIAQQFLRDLVDGYFPYEFKDKYPEGVLMKAVDRIHEKFVHGQEDPQGYVLSKEQFLRRLPKQVIKNGKVIDIVEKQHPAGSQQAQQPETTLITASHPGQPGPAVQAAAPPSSGASLVALRHRNSSGAGHASLTGWPSASSSSSGPSPQREAADQTSKPDGAGAQQQPQHGPAVPVDDSAVDESDFATINIRMPDGRMAQRIKIPRFGTVGQLRSKVKDAPPSGDFILRCAFPTRRDFGREDAALSIEEAGLFPSGVLIVVLSLPP